MSDRKIAITSLIITIISLLVGLFFGLRAEGLLHFEQSVVEQSVVEQSVVEQSVVEQSVVEQSVVEQSIDEQPVVREQPANGKKNLESNISIVSFIISLISVVIHSISSSYISSIRDKKKKKYLKYNNKKYKEHKLTVSAIYENKQKVTLTVQNNTRKPIYELEMMVAINQFNEQVNGLPYIKSFEKEHSLNLNRKAIYYIDLNEFKYQFDVVIVWYDFEKVKRSLCITLT